MLKKSGKSADPHLLTLPGFLRQRLLIAFLKECCGIPFLSLETVFQGNQI